MPVSSKVQQYEGGEAILNILSDLSWKILCKRPFRWQLMAAEAILQGKDVVLDVGTGCGKSLCFMLPLMLCKDDISITVSPLTALMIDQVTSSAILRTVAICVQTISEVGKDQLYANILRGAFQHIMVSPEIAASPEFHKFVWSKPEITKHLRSVNIDEAHCITMWGGSFRPDYANLGILRGRIPVNVPILAASATLPDHVLSDVLGKLRLANPKMVRVSNARPNIALSVRTMEFDNASKADLRFLIPQNANNADDIPVTLVYCNQRATTEDCADQLRDWAEEQNIPRNTIAYYHSCVGNDRKHEIEQLLSENKIRIVICTEALGMGCDLRNIARVILWGLPETFCSLVQRIGRAGRDLDADAEAILIVNPGIAKGEMTEDAFTDTIVMAAAEGEALNRPISEQELDRSVEVLDEEGVRIENADDEDDEDANAISAVAPSAPRSKDKRKVRTKTNTHLQETRALLSFVITKECRQKIWDAFFNNASKLQLVYQETTMYNLTGHISRCCDNCQPHLFPLENIVCHQLTGLKRGRKKKMPQEEQDYIRHKLLKFRDHDLMANVYSNISSLSSAMIISDEVINKIASCGELIRNYSHLRQIVRWGFGHDSSINGPNRWGSMLIQELENINNALEKRQADSEIERAHSTDEPAPYASISFADILTPENFYD